MDCFHFFPSELSRGSGTRGRARWISVIAPSDEVRWLAYQAKHATAVARISWAAATIGLASARPSGWRRHAGLGNRAARRGVRPAGAPRRRAGALAKRRRAPATGAFLPSWLCLLCLSPPLFAPSSIHWECISGGWTRYPRSTCASPCGGCTQQGRGERMGDAAKRTAASSAVQQYPRSGRLSCLA